jgi:hypothetical protein
MYSQSNLHSCFIHTRQCNNVQSTMIFYANSSERSQPLNVINLGQTKSDNISQMITLTGCFYLVSTSKWRVGQQCRLEQSLLQKITIPTKKVKIMPMTTIPTFIPTKTIPTTHVNCGYFEKQSWELNFMLGTLLFN